MPRVGLPTVYNDTHQLILNLRSIDRYIRLKGRVRGRHVQICNTTTLTVCVWRLQIAGRLSSCHSICGVWLHVQDPRKLETQRKNSYPSLGSKIASNTKKRLTPDILTPPKSIILPFKARIIGVAVSKDHQCIRRLHFNSLSD